MQVAVLANVKGNEIVSTFAHSYIQNNLALHEIILTVSYQPMNSSEITQFKSLCSVENFVECTLRLRFSCPK